MLECLTNALRDLLTIPYELTSEVCLLDDSFECFANVWRDFVLEQEMFLPISTFEKERTVTAGIPVPRRIQLLGRR